MGDVRKEVMDAGLHSSQGCPHLPQIPFQQAGLGIVDILGSQTAHKGGTLAEVHDQILHLVQQALKLRSVQLRDEAFHPLSQPR